MTTSPTAEQIAYIKKMTPYAEQAANGIVANGGAGGFSADVILAQWAHETNFGSANNLISKNNHAAIMKSGGESSGPRTYPTAAAFVDEFVDKISGMKYYVEVKKSKTESEAIKALGESKWDDQHYKGDDANGRPVSGTEGQALTKRIAIVRAADEIIGGSSGAAGTGTTLTPIVSTNKNPRNSLYIGKLNVGGQFNLDAEDTLSSGAQDQEAQEQELMQTAQAAVVSQSWTDGLAQSRQANYIPDEPIVTSPPSTTDPTPVPYSTTLVTTSSGVDTSTLAGIMAASQNPVVVTPPVEEPTANGWDETSSEDPVYSQPVSSVTAIDTSTLVADNAAYNDKGKRASGMTSGM